jgi:hypothetical protein
MTQGMTRRSVRPTPDRSSGHALELVRSALDVAELLVEHVVLAPSTRFSHRPSNRSSNRPGADFTKEVAEVAMLLRLAQRVLREEPDRVRIAALADRIAPVARSAATRNLLVVRPSRAAAHLLAHACLQQLGCVDAGFDELARAALGSSAAGAAERVPYRLLDVAWIRSLVLGDAELAHPALVLTPIGQGVDLVHATVDDAYAFSHALPYATDFGRVPLPATVDTALLAGTADALVLKALHEDDLDLLGELLMVPALLGTDWTTIQWFGWQVLRDTWRHYGFVPGPGLPEAEPAEDHEDAVRRVLGTVYHSTLVGGLAVATLVSAGRLPAPRPPAAAAFPDARVDPDDASWAWQRVWHRLDPSVQAHLGAVPAGIALHRALDELDVVAIVDSLGGDGVDALPIPLVLQAAELVNRMAVLVGR